MSDDARPTIILSPLAKKRRARRHPWIFSNEIQGKPQVAPGSIVSVRYEDDADVWTGYFNPHSLIALRILDSGAVDIDLGWVRSRVQKALGLRKRLQLHRDAIRLINGEADGLPGLVVDQYGKVLVVQSHTAGMDLLLPWVVSSLEEFVPCDGIHGRLDAEVRKLENVPLESRTLSGVVPAKVEVNCHGVRFLGTPSEGQKTGLFLDQMENIQALVPWARGAEVLDLCCYTGAFAITLAKAGAGRVEAIDSDAGAIAQARENARLNELGETGFEKADVFEKLKELNEKRRTYDLINLDPPAFAKRKKDVENAMRGYRELNRRAIRLVRPGGILSTATCSHHISRESFLEMLILAARDSGRDARILEARGPALDHPSLLAAPETTYLSFFILQIF